jgi:site-specific DNA-methyltransferase (adenine-specific)
MNGTYENIDCMELMANLKDKEVDLAIVDPPYGIKNMSAGGRGINGWTKWENKKWDSSIPSKDYFSELFRVSKNQIIWGGNYFISQLHNSSCLIIWDKGQREFSLADGEMAWASFDKPIRIFTYHRALANQENKIHPTQKPVKLYEWLLTNYAKPNDLILDTHCGSASSLIACENLGFKYIASELDTDYYNQSLQRLKNHLLQGKLFQRVGRDEIQISQPSMFA